MGTHPPIPGGPTAACGVGPRGAKGWACSQLTLGMPSRLDQSGHGSDCDVPGAPECPQRKSFWLKLSLDPHQPNATRATRIVCLATERGLRERVDTPFGSVLSERYSPHLAIGGRPIGRCWES